MWQTILAFVLLLISLVSSRSLDGRIVNGTNAEEGTFPYIVSIQDKLSELHICAGTIFTPCLILTAAHCVANEFPENVIIRYGFTDFHSKVKLMSEVEQFKIHEKFDPADYYANDIAVIKTKTHIYYNRHTVAPITLPPKNLVYSDIAVLIGWGLNATGGIFPNKLQQTDLKVYPERMCKIIFNGATTSNQLCSGTPGSRRGQCTRDSGGPLIGNIDGRPTQLGIVSWGLGVCGVPPYGSGVQTKVASYTDWIDVIKQFFKQC